eukprot:TRINITY_DN27198_c0_g1_i1.p1 TRINITY_DN27198_c0_g1~~TRINITY_DN27198_c0_g1_i1.p1  ORF type:complete len:466 (+),score=88.66 TRINITY_DN27198_c0_g1_i1:39-1400(+)
MDGGGVSVVETTSVEPPPPPQSLEPSVPTEASTNEEKRWGVLASFACHAFLNQFMFMNFIASKPMASAFRVNKEAITELYTVTLLSVLPSILLVAQLLDVYNWLVPFICVLCTAASGWMRVTAVDTRSYGFMVLANVFTAPGTALVFAGFKELPSKWFPEERLNLVATAVAVQSAFIGWACGALAPALLVSTEKDLGLLLLKQAVVASLCPIIFCLLHVSVPTQAAETARLSAVSASGDSPQRRQRRMSFVDKSSAYSASVMVSTPAFLLQGFASALLEGVGFAVPALLEGAYLEEGVLSLTASTWLGAIFIFAGAAFGLILGFCAPGAEHADKLNGLVLTIFWAAVITVFLLQKSMDSSPGILGSFSVIVILTIICGGATLGFVGLGLTLACSAVPDVPESHSGGLMGFMAFGFGALITETSVGRKLLSAQIASVIAASFMTVGILLRRFSG